MSALLLLERPAVALPPPVVPELVDAGATDAGAAAADAGAAAGEAPEESAEETVAPDSPRASIGAYLDLCRRGKFGEAAQYLDIVPESAGRGAELARRLKAVLDRYAWVDLTKISPRAQGNATDGLLPYVDEIGRIPGPGGAMQPVRLVRRAKPEGVRWVFSRVTVGRIDGWYDRLEERWLLEHIPAPLLRPGPADLLIWQWLAIPVLVLLAWGLGRILAFLTQALLGSITRRTAADWDDALLARLRGPFTLGWALLLLYAAVPWLGLYQPAGELVYRLLHVGFLVVLFWTVLRIIDIVTHRAATSAWALSHPTSKALIPLAARCAHVFVLAIAAVAVVSDLGYPVASLIAGLGIGGLAVALAAQKTVENLFGAFSLGLDQPIREGDFVKVEDFVGTVETIGLRSTRIRTLDRTLVSIPNGKLAEMRLESFAARDRLRLACTLGVVYGTTASQMREVLAGLERVLREHPKIWPDAVVVRFKEFGASSLDIEIMAWFLTTDWGEFQLIRQEVLIQFMEIVEKAGSSFAFPTRTVHLLPERSISANAQPSDVPDMRKP